MPALQADEFEKVRHNASKSFDLESLVLGSSEAQSYVVNADELDSAMAEIKGRYGSDDEFHEDLKANGLDEALQPLVGKSAGAICRTLELPFAPPYESIIKAASNIAYDQDRYMSAWLFVTQWLDGTTVWRSSDGSEIAHVTLDGIVNMQNK